MMHTVNTVLLSPIKGQLTGVGQVTALEMKNHIFRAYKEIDDVKLEDNSVRMMGGYHLAELLARLIEHIEKAKSSLALADRLFKM